MTWQETLSQFGRQHDFPDRLPVLERLLPDNVIHGAVKELIEFLVSHFPEQERKNLRGDLQERLQGIEEPIRRAVAFLMALHADDERYMEKKKKRPNQASAARSPGPRDERYMEKERPSQKNRHVHARHAGDYSLDKYKDWLLTPPNRNVLSPLANVVLVVAIDQRNEWVYFSRRAGGEWEKKTWNYYPIRDPKNSEIREKTAKLVVEVISEVWGRQFGDEAFNEWWWMYFSSESCAVALFPKAALAVIWRKLLERRNQPLPSGDLAEGQVQQETWRAQLMYWVDAATGNEKLERAKDAVYWVGHKVMGLTQSQLADPDRPIMWRQHKNTPRNILTIHFASWDRVWIQAVASLRRYEQGTVSRHIKKVNEEAFKNKGVKKDGKKHN